MYPHLRTFLFILQRHQIRDQFRTPTSSASSADDQGLTATGHGVVSGPSKRTPSARSSRRAGHTGLLHTRAPVAVVPVADAVTRAGSATLCA